MCRKFYSLKGRDGGRDVLPMGILSMRPGAEPHWNMEARKLSIEPADESVNV